ncbi:MAG: ATP-binding cassette domain-containing protein [Chloroflexia bacterium]
MTEGFPPLRPSPLATLRATVRLLYSCNPRAFVTSAVASLTEPLFFPALLWLLHGLLQEVSGPNETLHMTPAAVSIGVGLVGLILIQRLGVIVRDSSSTILRQQAWVVISGRIMQKLPCVPYPLFENNAFQARYGLVLREAAQRSITLVDSLLSTAPILLGAVGVAATLFALAPLLVLAMIAIAIPAGLIERRFSGAMYDLQEHNAPHQLRMEALTNMQVDAHWQRDVRVYGSDILPREYAALAERYLAELKRLTARFAGLRTLAALVQGIGIGLGLVALFALIGQGRISLPSLAVILPGFALLTGMISSLIYNIRSLGESLNYAATLFDFLAQRFAEQPPAAPVARTEAAGRTRVTSIRLHSVSYTYPETEKTALTDIACEFTPGLTAIVGPNGAGKSTLVKLLTGLVPPTTGGLEAVLESGEAVALSAVRKAVLFQDSAHFPFSIRQNVTMQSARTPGEEEPIAEALRQAGLWEAMAALPDGIDTVVGAGFGGTTDLSGGQWQRLALARLLYHDAPLLILDEPTASLDPLGERQIFDLLATFAKEKIILFTTHRYDTIRQADRIVVLVDGALAESGTHEELAANGRAFWSLYLGQGAYARR